MKIGIDLSFVRPDHKNGGTEAFMKNLIRGFDVLKRQGNMEDEIVYFIHRDIYEDYKRIFPGLSYRIYDLKGPHPLRTVCFQTFVLPGLVKKENLDLLYFPTFQTGLKGNWKLPLLVNPNDIQYKYYPEYFSFFKRCYFQIFYGNALKKADRLVAISAYVKGSYEKHFKKSTAGKLRVLYAPIDFDGASEEPVPALAGYEGEYILCVNSLTKHKNLITLVKAFQLLRQRGESRDLKLVIGGAKQNGAGEVAEYIKSCGMEEDVILTGRLSDGQLSYLYHHARLFVTPSLYEGFGMTPIEAMAAKCPVISSKETCLYEVTKGLARYYEPAADANALCAAIGEELKRDKKELEGELSRHREEMLCYSKEKVALAYMDLFHETAGIPLKMPEENQQVFERLFAGVLERMKGQGEKLSCTQKSFEMNIGVPPKKIDIASLLELEGGEFADALWLSCFQRLPSEEKRRSLRGKSKEEILRAATGEGAFAIRGITLLHNPYFKQRFSVRARLLSLAAGVKNLVFLRQLAKKMPKGLQKKVRKLFC